MFKILFVVIIMLGAAFGIPQIRNRIVGPLDPVLSRMGPLGDKINAPAKRWAARNEINLIIRKLAEDHNQNRGTPSPLGFQGWLKQNFRGGINDGGDPWGRPYYLVHTANQITVGSQGADRLRNTPDDVRLSVPLQ